MRDVDNHYTQATGTAMGWLKYLSRERAARRRWESGLVWQRVRYARPEGLTQALRLLSRPAACGRVALVFRPAVPLSALYVGIPAGQGRLLRQMAIDFGFTLAVADGMDVLLRGQKSAAVTDLPWERPFEAQIVDGHLFVDLVEGQPRGGSFLPQVKAPNGTAEPTWQLPVDPPPGVTLIPIWDTDLRPPACLTAAGPDGWRLGYSRRGVALGAAGCMNLYGRQHAVAAWLQQQLVQTVHQDAAGLVVLDGAGDLVPQLKRKAVVTGLLGKELRYMDIDGGSVTTGLNPLAIVPGESSATQLVRWQTWFGGMGVLPQGIALLEGAQQAGVTDIPSLQRWLQRQERHGRTAAVASLGQALGRLTHTRTLREWLDWPTNPFDGLPEGGLLFACRADSWERRQLLYAVLLGVLALPACRLVVHGFPMPRALTDALGTHKCVVVSNGPPLPDSTIILTGTHRAGAKRLADRYCVDDTALLAENLTLLPDGEAVVITDAGLLPISWQVGRNRNKSLEELAT